MPHRALLPLALALMFAATADAATVRVENAPRARYPGYGTYNPDVDAVHYVADSGEQNQLLVSYDADAQGVTVSDPGAVVSVGESCTRVDDHTAHCVPRTALQRYSLQHTEADLGDLDDELHTFRPTEYPIGGVAVRGGPGDDLLDGGAGDDELDGGPGRDTLLGGGLNDVLIDGDSSSAPDVMDGGEGVDLVSYRGRGDAVKVRLADERTDGAAGEGDEVRAVENAEGGDGDDVLDGGDGPNWLDGGDGSDVLAGRDGNDLLFGGDGRDRLVGADGADTIFGERGLDSSSCGANLDRVVDPVAGELLESRCELARFDRAVGEEASWSFPPNPVARTSGSASFRIGCVSSSDEPDPSSCTGTLTLYEASGRHRVLGRGRIAVTVFSDPPRPVRVALTALGRALAGRRTGVVTTASIRHAAGIEDVDWTIRLRVPR